MRFLRPVFFLSTLAAVLLSAPAIQAGPVEFGTSGSFNGGGSIIDLGGGNELEFLDQGFVLADIDDFSFSSFGRFDTGGIESLDTITVTSIDFQLTIAQLQPTVEDGLFTGTVSGEISFTDSGLVVTFDSPLSLTLGGVTYTILSPTFGLAIPNSQDTTTSVNGRIDVAVVPEPSSIALLGLAAPATFMYRRRAAKKA